MKNIELIISPKCNLGCKYCYVHRFRNEIFEPGCFEEESTITNLKLILEWLVAHEFNPNLEIFSGELLAQEVGFQVLETIYNFYKDVDASLRPQSIVIPTNFTFMCNDETNARVEDIRLKLNSIDILLGLSASFDGKYMEQNRPYLHDLDIPLGGIRDDAYYDKAFQYVNHIKGGFHPMLYSKGIADWKKNFMWFQDKFTEFDIPWENIYLLQVRNEEWTKEQVEQLCDFIEFIYEFAWDKCDHNPSNLVNFILRAGGFNILEQPYGTCGRGMTCGIQSQFTIRVSDLMMYPCHRTGYKDFYYGQMVKDEHEVLKFVSKNAELLITTYSTHKEIMPYCAQCPINHLCTGTCLGAQYESNKNLFVPIPTVCALTYALTITNMNCLKKYGAWGLMYNLIDPLHQQQFDYLEEQINVK